MFKGKKVKVRLKTEQKMKAFVGEIIDTDANWIRIKGRFYLVVKGETTPRVDEEKRELGIPLNNISLMRILPDDLDLDNLQYTVQDNRLIVDTKESFPISIDE